MNTKVISNNNRFFSWLASKFDIDLPQLNALLNVKKMILTGYGVQTNPESDSSESTENNLVGRNVVFNLQLLMYFFVGLFPCLGFAFESALTGMTVTYTLLMVTLTITFFLRFAGVIPDTAENQMLFPKPVKGATILAARIIHIAYYMGIVTLICGLPSILFAGFKFGIVAAVLFLLGLVLLLVTLIVITQLVFILASTRSDPRKIQSLVMYFLIFFLFFLVTSSTIVFQNFSDIVDPEELSLQIIDGAWLYFYPPAWMAGLVSVYVDGAQRIEVILGMIALIVPCIGFLWSMYILGTRFSKMLSDLGSVSGELGQEAGRSKGFKIDIGSKFLGRNDNKRAVYDLSLKLMKTDQAFKLKVYPTYGIILAFAGMFVFQNIKLPLEEIFNSGTFMLYLYMITSFIATTTLYVQYGSQFKAAWIYQALPIERPGEVVSMTIAAFVVRFVLPIICVVVIATGLFWGIAGVIDALYAGLVTILMCFLQSYRLKYVFPFSQDMVTGTDGASLVLDQFLVAIPLIALAVLHALLKFKLGPIAVACGCLVLLLALYAVFRRLDQRGWESFAHK